MTLFSGLPWDGSHFTLSHVILTGGVKSQWEQARAGMKSIDHYSNMQIPLFYLAFSFNVFFFKLCLLTAIGSHFCRFLLVH